ncbi:low molecular weight protein-tyrosine-phosphatase [Limosilactobacillus secaliphilus]|nr:low molecular weight protein-tyrosine-phosphatase [Limosilactobacillus secaliphilus]
MKVLFVCLGNICRSPLAEAMFREMLEEKGLAQAVSVDSAATSTEEEGNPPYPGIRQIMRKYHLDNHGHVSRPLNRQDFKDADLIIGMDDMNLANIRAMAPSQYLDKIHGIYDLLPELRGQSIPDPWYTHRFQATYDALKHALPSWLDYVEKRVS